MSKEAEGILRSSGAILEGHFLLASGLHSPTYFEKFRILENPKSTEKLCKLIADHFRLFKTEVVAGPTTGGVIIAYEVARQLGVRGIFAEKEGDARVFRRGFRISPGERVLVVDDVLTTGGSIQQVVEEVKRRGAKVAGVGVLVDRTNGAVNFGHPFFSCLGLSVPAYSSEKCPECQKGIPLVKPGSSA
ncbi:MAG: orotate phosphoribosyltransferase [Chloroflexi bacterium]|nr:orotate phosphoribosyltransferase [Chloroflexota bacterium]